MMSAVLQLFWYEQSYGRVSFLVIMVVLGVLAVFSLIASTSGADGSWVFGIPLVAFIVAIVLVATTMRATSHHRTLGARVEVTMVDQRGDPVGQPLWLAAKRLPDGNYWPLNASKARR